ncbi:MAG: EAL and HDOD domain-containing protein [Burkholderiales bacterium]
MLDIFRALFRSEPPPGEGASYSTAHDRALDRAYVRLNKVSSLVTPDDVASGPPPSRRAMSSYVLRDPVLDRDGRVAGYEFSLDRQRQMRFKDRHAVIRKLYDDTLIRELSGIGVDTLLDHRMAIIEVATRSVAKGIISDLPGANTVLILDSSQEASRNGAAYAGIDAVLDAGFRVGWKLDTLSDAVMGILARCEFVQIDTPAFDGVQLKEFARKLKSMHRPDGVAPLGLIARDVQSSDDFQLCFRVGFDYFQGPFISSRESWTPQKINVNRVRVIQILDRLRSGANNAVLAEHLRTEPVLTFKLLRYVNSPAFGVKRQIGTISEALRVVGGQKLYRWLSLLLFDMKARSFAERALLEQVLIRARLMESLGAGTIEPDLAYLTGLFSMLEQFLGQPIEALFAQINLPAEVEDALLRQTGPYAHFLELAKACEQGEPGLIAVIAATCGLHENAVDAQLIAAMDWAYNAVAISE